MDTLISRYNRFFTTYPSYQKYALIASFREMHDWLWEADSIAKMMDAVKFSRPAIEGVVTEIESMFGDREDIVFDDFTKKATGMLIKYVLEHFGYISSIQKNISKGKQARFFTSGMVYELDESRVKYRLVTTLSIVPVKEK